MKFKIALIRGDGIGPEIVNETVAVIDRVGELLSPFTGAEGTCVTPKKCQRIPH